MSRLSELWEGYLSRQVGADEVYHEIWTGSPETLSDLLVTQEFIVSVMSDTADMLRADHAVIPNGATERRSFEAYLKDGIDVASAGLLARLGSLGNAAYRADRQVAVLARKLRGVEQLEGERRPSWTLVPEAYGYIARSDVATSSKLQLIASLAQAVFHACGLAQLATISRIDIAALQERSVLHLAGVVGNHPTVALVERRANIPWLGTLAISQLEVLQERFESAWRRSIPSDAKAKRAVVADPSGWLSIVAASSICAIANQIADPEPKASRMSSVRAEFWATPTSSVLEDYPRFAQYPTGTTVLRNYEHMRQAVGLVAAGQSLNAGARAPTPGSWVTLMLDDLAIIVRVPTYEVIPRTDIALAEIQTRLFESDALRAYAMIDAMSPRERGVVWGSRFRVLEDIHDELSADEVRRSQARAASSAISLIITNGVATAGADLMLFGETLQHAAISGAVASMISLMQEVWPKKPKQ